MPKNMRSTSAEHFDALWSWNTLERRPQHCTLDFHTKDQVCRKPLSVSLQVLTIQRSILVSRRCQAQLAQKKREVKKEEKKEKRREITKKKKKKEREKKKRERKKERVRESHGSTHSSSSCTQTIKNAAPLPFQASATPLRSAPAHMHKGRRTLRPQS